MDYLYRLTLPFSKKTISYRELTNREIITLSKANIMLPEGDKDNNDGYADVLNNVVYNCVKQKDLLEQLNFVDYLFLILKIRITSLGQEVFLVLPSKDKDYESVNITLDLQKIILTIYENTKELLEQELLYENLKIKLDWPSYKDEPYLKEFEDKQTLLFLKDIEINSKSINFKNLNFYQKQAIYDKLPLKLHLALEETILPKIEKTSNILLLNLPDQGELTIDLLSNTQTYLRLFFTENLKEIYQQYYLLASKKNITPEYLDKISLSERKLYFSYMEIESTELEQNSTGNNTSSNSSNQIEELMREFGDT